MPVTKKLSQVNAVLRSRKEKAMETITAIHQMCMKRNLFSGQSRTYRPYDAADESKKLPDENQVLQKKAVDLIGQAAVEWAEVGDLTVTQDAGNMSAKADVVVDNAVFLKDVPVASLLYMNTQLDLLAKFVDELPVLDPSKEWVEEPASRQWRSKPVVTVKKEKKLEALVKIAPTQYHPGQAETFSSDVPVGEWTTTELSGALSEDTKRRMLLRVRKLSKAVKEAVEVANMGDAQTRSDASAIMKYVFGDKVLGD